MVDVLCKRLYHLDSSSRTDVVCFNLPYCYLNFISSGVMVAACFCLFMTKVLFVKEVLGFLMKHDMDFWEADGSESMLLNPLILMTATKNLNCGCSRNLIE